MYSLGHGCICRNTDRFPAVCRLGTSSPDKSLEEKPLSPTCAGHVQRPRRAFPGLLHPRPRGQRPAGLRAPRVRAVVSAPPHRRWGHGVCTAPAPRSRERSAGNAAGGQSWLRQHRRAPAPPSRKGLLFFMLPPLQSRCRKQAAHVDDDDACSRSNPRLLLITWQGQLWVNAVARLGTAVIAELSVSAAATCSSWGTSPQHIAVPGIYHFVPLRGGTELHSAGC